jgi:hypothetical protein
MCELLCSGSSLGYGSQPNNKAENKTVSMSEDEAEGDGFGLGDNVTAMPAAS